MTAGAPSFNRLMAELIATRTPDDPIWQYNDKLGGRRLAESRGIRVPELLQGPCSIEDLHPLTDRPFVVKPVRGCSALGVFVLTPWDGPAPTDERWWWESLRQRILRWGDVRRAAYQAKAERPWSAGHPDAVGHPWIMEEDITGTGGMLPYDWKAYCVGGRVELVRQISRRGRKHAVKSWWPGAIAWVDAGVIDGQSTVDPTMPPPLHPRELIDMAEMIAVRIPGPFVRVDMYDTASGPVFGEITPHPAGGRIQFTSEWDMRLGAAWEACCG